MRLPRNEYRSVIRCLLSCERGRAQQIRHATFTKMRELGIPRDMSKAETKLREGSDQFDGQSIIAWINQIKPEHKRAIWQLIAIDATAASRG